MYKGKPSLYSKSSKAKPSYYSQPNHQFDETESQCKSNTDSIGSNDSHTHEQISTETSIENSANETVNQIESIQTQYHGEFQTPHELFIDIVQDIQKLGVAYVMDNTRKFDDYKSAVKNNIYQFQENLLNAKVNVRAKDNTRQRLALHERLAKEYKYHFSEVTEFYEYLTSNEDENSQTKKRKAGEFIIRIESIEDLTEEFIRIYKDVNFNVRKDEEKTARFHANMKKFGEKMAEFCKHTYKRESPSNFYELMKNMNFVTIHCAEFMAEVFSNTKFNPLTPVDPAYYFPDLFQRQVKSNANSEMRGIETIYQEMSDYITEHYMGNMISSPIDDHESGMNRVLEKISEYCGSFNVSDRFKEGMTELFVSFVNYCNSIQCSPDEKSAKMLMEKHIDESSDKIEMISGLISSTPKPTKSSKSSKSKKVKSKDEEAVHFSVNWKVVHKKLTKLVAKSKKGLASARDSLNTYLKGSGQQQLMRVHEGIIASLQGSQDSPRTEQKSMSKLDKKMDLINKHDREVVIGVAAFFTHYSLEGSDIKITKQDIPELIEDAKKVIKGSTESKYFDTSKISDLEQHKQGKFHRKLMTLKGISQGPEADHFIDAWYDFFRGGSLEALIVKFAGSYHSSSETKQVFIIAEGIAAQTISLLNSKKKLSVDRVNILVMLALALVSKSREKSPNRVTIDLDFKEAVSLLEKSNPITTEFNTSISESISQADIGSMSNRIYDYIEDFAKSQFDASIAKAKSEAFAMTIANNIASKKGVDTVMQLRNMARLGLGFLIKIATHNLVVDSVKADLMKTLKMAISSSISSSHMKSPSTHTKHKTAK